MSLLDLLVEAVGLRLGLEVVCLNLVEILEGRLLTWLSHDSGSLFGFSLLDIEPDGFHEL